MDTLITGAGANSNIDMQVDPTYQAARASLRPLEHFYSGKQGGHYIMSMVYSNTAAKPTAGSDIFSMRWTDTNMLFILKRLTMQAIATTAYTAAAAQDFAVYKAQGFTVSPSGGTQIVPTIGQRLRTSNMQASGLSGSSGVVWISSGDLLTTGTRTLETQPFGVVQYDNAAAAGGTLPLGLQPLFQQIDMGSHPFIIASNEGIVIQTPIGNAAIAGVSKYVITMEWVEAVNY